MTYKQIEGFRELRLWIGQVIVPAAGLAAIVMSNPKIKNAVSDKVRKVKQKFRLKKD